MYNAVPAKGCSIRSITETTAHSLSATLGFLSVYADLQEEIYQQIISVVGYERDPVSHHFRPSYLFSV